MVASSTRRRRREQLVDKEGYALVEGRRGAGGNDGGGGRAADDSRGGAPPAGRLTAKSKAEREAADRAIAKLRRENAEAAKQAAWASQSLEGLLRTITLLAPQSCRGT